MAELRGAFAAAVTPLRDAGNAIDEGAIAPYVDFLADGDLDGLLVLGTTGEGILCSLDERRRVLGRFLEAARGRLSIVAHCGAQTTADTVALAAHAAETGATAVAVIGPPYFALDERALLEHFAAAAAACSPLPFYVYEFAARTGYAVPLAAIDRLRERAPNLVGLKVSDTPWEQFEPYLLDGLDILAGPEGFIHRALKHGAVGAVSGLAAAFPELVAALVREPSAEAADRVGAVRAAAQRFPFHAALKAVLGLRGVPVGPDVRPPLRRLSDDELRRLERTVEDVLAQSPSA